MLSQYSNPTEINKGELAEPVLLSTQRMLIDSNAQVALHCSATEELLTNKENHHEYKLPQSIQRTEQNQLPTA